MRAEVERAGPGPGRSAQPSALICVLAKPPEPGRVKTRLAATLGPTGAATLARCFLEDTLAGLAGLDWAHVIVASTGPLATAGHEVWPQGEGDLGARLERVLGRALTLAPCALAIGADSPGRPASLFAAARAALADSDSDSGVDAVLGPADDGGFHLIGLRRCPPGLLAGLPWSSPETCQRTEAQLWARGLTVARTQPWFDVDVPPDLERLRALLARGELHAPATARALGLGLGEPRR